jgi:DNA-binding NarL/FixJ family response regulator
MRVFLCDDTESHRVLVRKVLETEHDFEVVGEAVQATRCLDAVRELQPDLVLLDVAMPGLNGIRALPLFREAVPDAQIVMLSTAWRPEDEARALAAGASAYVQKPRNVFDLPSLVRGAVGQAGALVEQLVRNWMAGDRDRAFAAMHHDVEFQPLLAPDPLHGIAQMRRYLEGLPEPEKAAKVRPLALLERQERVVVLAEAEVPHEEHVERMNPGWVMTVRNGKVARIKTFRSSEDAIKDAGVSDGAPGVIRRTFERWSLMTRRALVRPRLA